MWQWDPLVSFHLSLSSLLPFSIFSISTPLLPPPQATTSHVPPLPLRLMPQPQKILLPMWATLQRGSADGSRWVGDSTAMREKKVRWVGLLPLVIHVSKTTIETSSMTKHEWLSLFNGKNFLVSELNGQKWTSPINIYIMNCPKNKIRVLFLVLDNIRNKTLTITAETRW
jgi:hypothetical protein